MVYRLDALDAYNRHLVKRIAALGVTFTSSPAAGALQTIWGGPGRTGPPPPGSVLRSKGRPAFGRW